MVGSLHPHGWTAVTTRPAWMPVARMGSVLSTAELLFQASVLESVCASVL